MNDILTDKDLAQIEKHGSSIEKVKCQIENFRKGFGFLPLERAATSGQGVILTDAKAAEYYSAEYSSCATECKIVKFVPASGAATRMFKELFEFVSSGVKTPAIEKLLLNLNKFAFYNEIASKTANADDKAKVQAVLDYGSQLPKALILFHNYPDNPRTALAEHLSEGAMYASANNIVRIHFTISTEHEPGFKQEVEKIKEHFEKKYGVKYDISFSQQKNSTDTIAVTPDNEPFREDDGSLLFRPAGHGALIENLNVIDSDVIFIKNIDNVTADHLKADTVLYKKVIAGILLSTQKKIFNYLNILTRGADDSVLEKTASFVTSELFCELPSEFNSWEQNRRKDFLFSILNRPLRVCGMVKNEGEPGGGPFWVRNQDGTISLQIAEPSQISPEQSHLLKEGTHFNPVDLVCAVKDYKGEKFDLTKYTDPATGFISEKSKNGRPLKAQELPGLWNGAMANWNTIFVEVPVSTFTPVKEVTDLLRPQHQ